MFCKEVVFYLYKADSNADLKKIVREGNSSIGARPCLFFIKPPLLVVLDIWLKLFLKNYFAMLLKF